MCYFRFFSLLGFCQYISREIFLGLLEIVGNLILEQGDRTTNLFKSWIPANLSDVLITHWNCYPFSVCNKETISNLICVGFQYLVHVLNLWWGFGVVWAIDHIQFSTGSCGAEGGGQGSTPNQRLPPRAQPSKEGWRGNSIC